MARQALYRKWRSQTFAELIGQEHITQTLQNAIETNRIAHAYLFTGPRGTGKTSTARILAKAVNCTGKGVKPCNACPTCRAVTEGRLMDLIEIDAASNTSVDDIRDLRDKVGFRPSEAKTKFYIIDEVHMLSKSAFNALLKTLEEPPEHVIFVLATTEPEKIPATITSRCQRFDFRRIKVEDVAARLRFILEQEDLRADDAALTFIARQGGGSMRDAISLLDQLTAYGQETITLELVHSVLGAADVAATKEFVDHLLAGDIAAGLDKINQVINDGVDPRQFTLTTLEYLRGLLLLKHGQSELLLNLPEDMLKMMRGQIVNVSAATLLQATRRFNRAIKDFKSSASEALIPQLPLELAFIESIVGEAQPVPAAQMITDSLSPTYTTAPKSPPPAAPKPVAAQPAPTAPQPASLDAPENLSGQLEPPVAANRQPPPVELKTLTKDELRGYWPAIVDHLKQHNPSFQQYLNRDTIADVVIQGQKITIQFAPNYHKAKDRAEKHKEVIIDAFQHILGKGWYIVFTVASKKKPIDASPPSLATQTTAPDSSSETNDLIKAALEMGGQIKT
jgi:DNA polymerase-3 subunit gamma/tau